MLKQNGKQTPSKTLKIYINLVVSCKYLYVAPLFVIFEISQDFSKQKTLLKVLPKQNVKQKPSKMVGRTKNGTIYYKCYYLDEMGVRRQKKVQNRNWKSLNEARKAERDFLSSPKLPKKTLFELWDDFISFQKTKSRDNTITNYTRMYSRYISPFFGNAVLSQITAGSIEKYQIWLSRQGLGGTYVLSIQKLFKSLLNYAVKRGMLLYNVFTFDYFSGKTKHQEVLFWSVEEYRRFSENITDKQDKAIFHLLFYGGLRIGELLGLTFEDYDGSNVRINKQLLKSGKIGEVKSSNGNRVVALPRSVTQALDAYLGNCTHRMKNPRNAIFTIGRSGIKGRKDNYCKIANVKQIRIHDFRHSNCVLLLSLGFTFNEVAKRLGDDVNTIVNTYSHSLDDYNERVVAKLNEL